MIALAIAEELNDGSELLEAAIRAFHRCTGAFSLVIGSSKGVMGGCAIRTAFVPW